MSGSEDIIGGMGTPMSGLREDGKRRLGRMRYGWLPGGNIAVAAMCSLKAAGSKFHNPLISEMAD
jgi:hypothetical protein